MRKLSLTLLTFLLFLSPNVVLSEDWKDLVFRDGIAYKKFSQVSFTGKITGMTHGPFKNGKQEGTWMSYWDNGQLLHKGNHKNGEREGDHVQYNKDGTLNKKVSGTYKNDKKISD